MSTIGHRIHLGIMGDAFCHATAGWFCAEVPLGLTHIFDFIVRFVRSIGFDMER